MPLQALDSAGKERLFRPLQEEKGFLIQGFQPCAALALGIGHGCGMVCPHQNTASCSEGRTSPAELAATRLIQGCVPRKQFHEPLHLSSNWSLNLLPTVRGRPKAWPEEEEDVGWI